MVLQNIILTKEDFNNSKLQEIINKCARKECYAYASELLNQANIAHKNSDSKNEAIFILLSYISSLIYDSVNDVFITFGAIPKDNSAIDELNSEQINFLSAVIPEISDSELKSRMAHILWIKKRDFKMIKLAVEAYLDSANCLEDPKLYTIFVERLERASNLAALLGRDSELFVKVMEVLERTIEKYHKSETLNLTQMVMEIMQRYQRGDYKKYAELSKEIAERLEQVKDFDRAKEYWLTKAEWDRLAKNKDEWRSARINAAETHVKFATLHIQGEHPSYTHAEHRIEQAIISLRKIENTNERVRQLHKLLLEYQEKSLTEYKKMPLVDMNLSREKSTDFISVTKKAKDSVKGKSFNEGLSILAFGLFNPLSYDYVRKHVENSIKKHPVIFIPQKSIHATDGKTTAKSDSVLTADESNKSLLNEMYCYVKDCHYSTFAENLIEPARRQLNIEHNTGIREWFSLIDTSLFVPYGREYFFARALHAGFVGDLLVASHLLIPQIEHSISNILEQNGVITSNLHDNGIQEERNINKLLYLPEIEKIFGINIAFHLRCLLIERFGLNFRNTVAHGLSEIYEVESYTALYLWWFVLRLCLMSIPMPEPTKQESSSK